jgi:membrane associated rhomboid family serine protease
VRRFFLKGGNPATLAIISTCVLSWFCAAVLHSASPFRYLMFDSAAWPLPLPWGVATWPLVENGHPLFVLFALMWLFSMGGSLERSWGTRTFVAFFAATNALTAISLWVGGLLFHQRVVLDGLWLGLAPLTIAWCLINRRETVMFNLFIPIPAMWLAWLTVAIVWWSMGPPLFSLFALAGCAAAWWYVTQGRFPSSGGYTAKERFFGGLRGGSGNSSKGDAGNRRFRDFDGEVRGEPGGRRNPLDIVGRLRDEQEKRKRDKRLEDMFRRSGYDDSDDRRDRRR